MRHRDEILRSRAGGGVESGYTWCAPSGSHRFFGRFGGLATPSQAILGEHPDAPAALERLEMMEVEPELRDRMVRWTGAIAAELD
jgi:hypothetical protein